jgi:hypothetical protein
MSGSTDTLYLLAYFIVASIKPSAVFTYIADLCQRRWIAVQLDECITPYGVHYIGGRDPPRAGGQEGGGQGRRL